MIINSIVLIAGLLVYAGYGIWGFVYLAAATGISYFLGLLIPRKRWLMWVGIAVNVLMLTLVKLQPVTGMQLLAPLGISYFSLQIIAYLVDIYRGKYAPERNFIRYALFVTYLPHLFIGPIQSYDTMSQALFENRHFSWENFLQGAARALWGGFKKLVIATRAGVIIGAISGTPETYSGAYALAAMLLYSIQLYSDFSGGIDIVLGVSKMLGITLHENFDAPFLSQSFQEFWRRWHITLGAWLRNYVYIPLGGNKKGAFRKAINMVITFLVSGIWHGVQYLLWGLINGLFVIVGTRLQTKCKTLNRAVTFLLISLLWAFFIWPDTWTALCMLGSLFTTFNYGDFFATIGSMGLTLGDWIVFATATALLCTYDIWAKQLRLWFANRHFATRTAIICSLGLLVLVFGMYGIGFDAEAFIYSRF